MYIKNIRLQNWKNFTKADIAVQDRAFLVGPNAAGKSNFLDALRFLNDLTKPGGGLERAVSDRGGLKKIRSLSARTTPEVEISVELIESEKDVATSWEYTLKVRQENRGTHRTLVAQEYVKRNEEVILSRPTSKDNEDILRLTQTSLEQINDNVDFRPVYSFFQEIRYIHLIPQLIRQPELFFNTNISLSEDAFGFHFIEKIINTPKPQRVSRLKKIEEALRIAVPQLTNLSESKDSNGVPHLEAIYEHWRPNAGKQQEAQFSDGTIRLIGLLWSILENKSVLLLEEPELSLHPAIVKKIPILISNLSKNKKYDTQIFISTHSPDLLSDPSISANEIILLSPNKEGTSIAVAGDNREIRLLLESGMTIEDVILPKITPKNIDQLTLFT